MPAADSPLEALASRLGYRFTEPALLREALTHASAGDTHNERLEFLGDAVLNLVVAEDLFERFPSEREGILTERKARIVARATVEKVAGRLGLEEAMRLGGSLESRGSVPRSLLGNALEAILGAIWSDSPPEAAFRVSRDCVRAWFAPELAQVAEQPALSPKQELQALAQARGWELPRYELTEEFSHPATRAFRVRVALNGRLHPGVWGSSKREAERRAATAALRELDADEGQTS